MIADKTVLKNSKKIGKYFRKYLSENIDNTPANVVLF